MMPMRHFFLPSSTACTSLSVSSAVLSVVSSSQIFSFDWFWRASMRQVSRISAVRFSFCFCVLNPLFCMVSRSCVGLRLRTKMCVVWFLGVTTWA